MRDRARRAALVPALAALALAAAGCDLVSSLTPFGLEEAGPGPVLGTYNGAWEGVTSTSGTVSFTVVSGEITGIVLTHQLSCGAVEEFAFEAMLIDKDGGFSSELALDPQGTALLSGRFTSPQSCSATYSFSSLPTSTNCETSGGGSFTAEKTVQVNP